MREYVLFQMTEPVRQLLIDQHLFYVKQAKNRLLLQFSELNTKESAEQFIKSWMKENQYRFNPGFHDEGDLYAEACERYHALLDLGNQTRLSVVAGMYHEWEKQLRQWLVDEIKHWCSSEQLKTEIWKANSGELAELMESVGWDWNEQPCYQVIDACRLVVNVYKHGDGPSIETLRAKYPQFLVDEFADTALTSSDPFYRPLNYMHLKINDTHIQEFSDAIVAFWNDVPDNIHDNQDLSPPAWFSKARLKQDSTLEKPAAHG